LLQDAVGKAVPALKRFAWLYGINVIFWRVLELGVNPLPINLLPLPRCYATPGGVGDFFGAIAAFIHLVKKIPVAHNLSALPNA